jgi:hypothetical protein
MIMRMLGAARLSTATFEDVEKDTSATKQALIVVVLVSIAAGVGGLLAGDEVDVLRGLGFGIIRGVVTWAVWALVIMFVGTKILKTEATEADWGQLARTTGFAQTPGILNVLVFLSGLLTIVVGIWQLIAMLIAVRQALDYTSTLRAFFVVLIALIPAIIINAIILSVLNI